MTPLTDYVSGVTEETLVSLSCYWAKTTWAVRFSPFFFFFAKKFLRFL